MAGIVASVPLSPVVPRLYVSGKNVARQLTELRKAGVTAIVNATPTLPNHFESEGILYKRIAVDDTPQDDLSAHFEAAATFIQEARSAGRSVLVHCQAGVSRSVSLVAAYLVRHENMSLLEAMARIRAVRPMAWPNQGFWRQLIKWELDIRGSVSVDVDMIDRQKSTLAFVLA